MAGTSLFALLDDIATVLDDLAVMTKVATKKTAGVLGDDLALNAQQVTGVSANRELPVVWAVAKGSLKNKVILVPSALLISVFIPWAITPLLMIGGAYLCFEGCEKIFHALTHKKEEAKHKKELGEAFLDTTVDMVAFEKKQIKGAIRTDFILSAEIIVISLGTVAGKAFGLQVGTLIAVALVMTIGVYGLVAGIVKIDDLGFYLNKKNGAGFLGKIGLLLIKGTPYLMKGLSTAGLLAMFLVGGGILTHGIPFLHHFIEHVSLNTLPLVASVLPMLINGFVGLIAGSLVLLVVSGVKKIRG